MRTTIYASLRRVGRHVLSLPRTHASALDILRLGPLALLVPVLEALLDEVFDNLIPRAAILAVWVDREVGRPAVAKGGRLDLSKVAQKQVSNQRGRDDPRQIAKLTRMSDERPLIGV